MIFTLLMHDIMMIVGKKIMNERSIKSAAKVSMCPTLDTDKAFDLSMQQMTMDVSRVWTSFDLYDA